MLIYRVENSNGNGPYGSTTGGSRIYNDNCPDDCYDNPCIWDCGEEGSELHDHYYDKPGEWKKFHFGFSSMSSLKRWFRSSKGRKAMAAKAGMRLAVYRVPPEYVISGHAQVIFRKDLAEFDHERCLETMKVITPEPEAA